MSKYRRPASPIHNGQPGLFAAPLALYRRKKGLVAILTVSLLGLLYLWHGNGLSSRLSRDGAIYEKTIRIQKERPAGAVYRIPSQALESMAHDQGKLRANVEHEEWIQGAPVTRREHTLLLLDLMFNPNFVLPDDWESTGEFTPKTEDGLAKALSHAYEGPVLAKDVSLLRTDRAAWIAKHRHAHPITVFSKTYCQFSRKAKAFLHSLHADPVIHELDQRQDFVNVQRFILNLTGHRTVPAVFVQEQLLGGYDDLERLNKEGHLISLLHEGGALFE